MPKRSKYKFSIEGKPLYPHIKLTREPFPRVLATRIIADDDAEYFGAFLNRTNARILIDFLNRTFRLRSCLIDIDGSFNYPCAMHYKRRCVAPCVSDLTDHSEYLEMVRLARMFLLNDRSLFGSILSSKIADASDNLDFEAAGKWRDVLDAAEAYWSHPRQSVWLDGTSDTISYRVTDAGLDVILISQKGRRVLGERIFSFASAGPAEAGQAISEVIGQFYLFHVPKEIRVSFPLPTKSELEKILYERIGSKVRIVFLTEKNRKLSTEKALSRSSAELDLKRKIVPVPPSRLLQALRSEFKLSQRPQRITAIDVAHISGTDQVAASVSWMGGRMESGSSLHWLSDATSELGSLQGFVERLVASRMRSVPELLLVDGGPAQLNAAMAAGIPENISIVSAVKPAGEHGSIAYFLGPARTRVEFEMSNEAHRLLRRLRDEAHEYANAVHRDTRDFANYYRMAAILPSLTETQRRALLTSLGSILKVSSATQAELKRILPGDRIESAVADLRRYRSGDDLHVAPLVVLTRLQEENGAAEDLRPIGP